MPTRTTNSSFLPQSKTLWARKISLSLNTDILAISVTESGMQRILQEGVVQHSLFCVIAALHTHVFSPSTDSPSLRHNCCPNFLAHVTCRNLPWKILVCGYLIISKIREFVSLKKAYYKTWTGLNWICKTWIGLDL